jgi:hypothetical protein
MEATAEPDLVKRRKKVDLRSHITSLTDRTLKIKNSLRPFLMLEPQERAENPTQDNLIGRRV